MRNSIFVSAIFAAGLSIFALSGSVQATQIVISDVCSSSSRTAAFDGSCYIGSDDHSYGDVIGDVNKFGISGAVIEKPTADSFTVRINTAYAGNDGASGTHYGALFLDQAWRAGSNGQDGAPFDSNHYDTTASGQNNNYLFDRWLSGDWGYVFVPDDYSPGTGNKSGSGSLYAVQEDNIIFADNVALSGTWRRSNSSGSGAFDDVTQPVQYAVNGASVDGNSPEGGGVTGDIALATGTWEVDADDGFILYTINAAGIPGGEEVLDFGISWAMTCANDIVQGWGQLPAVPIPAGFLLLASALGGLGLMGAARRRTAS